MASLSFLQELQSIKSNLAALQAPAPVMPVTPAPQPSGSMPQHPRTAVHSRGYRGTGRGGHPSQLLPARGGVQPRTSPHTMHPQMPDLGHSQLDGRHIRQQEGPGGPPGGPLGGPPGGPCDACGEFTHRRSNCKFRNMVCFFVASKATLL